MQVIRIVVWCFCIIGLTFAEHSPVFLWGAYGVTKPSLKTVSSEEFKNLMADLLSDKALVVFMENDLSSKDFLCRKGVDGGSCYSRLEGVRDKTYYASVERPVETLHKINGKSEYNYVDDAGNLAKPLELGVGKINLLRFNESNSSNRRSKLQLHDSVMASISATVGDNVFFMYASAPSAPALKRKRRQTANEDQGYVVRDGANLLLYYNSLNIIEGNTVTPLEIDRKECKSLKQCNVIHHNDSAMSVTLTPTTGFPLTFDITLHAGYYFMKNVIYNNLKFLSTDVYAPTDFSYFCGNLTLRSVQSNTEKESFVILQWNYLQFQAPFNNTSDTNFAFGDAWHCVGFFSSGILSGLLIAVLLLTITFIGICWMMDINTMDRFDDPKGKTITINASE